MNSETNNNTTTDNENIETVVHESIFDELIETFCADNRIDDMRTASQSVWNSCLRNIYKHLFKNSDVLKSKETRETPLGTRSNDNAYDIKRVNELLDIYIYDLCMRYDKEISIIGFSTLTGIENTTIHEWGNNNKCDELSKSRMNIYKKLNHFREESLSNKLATGNKNPVGILAILNRHYSWNLPGVSREQAPKQALSAADLPRLGGSELCGNNTQLPELGE